MAKISVTVLFLALIFPSICFGASKNFYTVKKGDTLSAIALKQWGAARLWPEIAKANGINSKRPRYIFIGEKLRIPGIATIRVRKHNTSPFNAKGELGDPQTIAAIEKTPYPEEIKYALRKTVSENQPEDSIIIKGDNVDCISSGGTGVTCNKNGYRFAWPDKKWLAIKKWEYKEAGGQNCFIGIINECGNFISRCRLFGGDASRENPVGHHDQKTMDNVPIGKPDRTNEKPIGSESFDNSSNSILNELLNNNGNHKKTDLGTSIGQSANELPPVPRYRQRPTLTIYPLR